MILWFCDSSDAGGPTQPPLFGWLTLLKKSQNGCANRDQLDNIYTVQLTFAETSVQLYMSVWKMHIRNNQPSEINIWNTCEPLQKQHLISMHRITKVYVNAWIIYLFIYLISYLHVICMPITIEIRSLKYIR